MIKINKDVCKKIFSDEFFEMSDEQKEELDLYVQSVLKDNSWTDVFKEFNSYLRTNFEKKNQ